MKVIIAGSRTVTSEKIVANAIAESGFKITEVVCGGAAGADELGRQWALAHSIPVHRFPANWNKFGKAAGPIRNRQMAEYADALILIWTGNSPGSRNMLVTMQGTSKPIYDVRIPN